MRFIGVCCFCLAVFAACNDAQKKKPDEKKTETVVEEFNRMSSQLESHRKHKDFQVSALYDEIGKRHTDRDSMRWLLNLRYRMASFYDLYDMIKRDFIKACGDSSGDAIPLDAEGRVEITNSFFTPDCCSKILTQLNNAQDALRSHAPLPVAYLFINAITYYPRPENEEFTNEGWRKAYLANVPPVAALTILNKWENDVKSTEVIVLKQCYDRVMSGE